MVLVGVSRVKIWPLLLVAVAISSCGFSDSSEDALTVHAARCQPSAVSDLLEGGHDPNSRDSDGVSAAQRAVEGGGSGNEAACLETLRVLISHGADLSQPDDEGTPVLAWLLIGNNGVDMLRYLQEQDVELCGRLPEVWDSWRGVSDMDELVDSVAADRPELATASSVVVSQCEAK